MSKKDLSIHDLAAYKYFFEQTHKKIKNIRLQTAYSVNKTLIELYLWIGEHIVKNQEKYGWGKGIEMCIRDSCIIRHIVSNQAAVIPI